jgi:hypothetical protein
MLTVRELEDKDFAALSEFLPKGFPYTTKEFWLPLFDMWWASNPAYRDGFPRGWVLETDTSIAGFIGNIPVKFSHQGNVRIAALSNSWYVDPQVRGIFSLRLFNEFIRQKHASFLLFKKDDESLGGLLDNYAFQEYVLPKNQEEYVYIIDKKKVDFIFLRFLLKLRIPKFSELSSTGKKFISILSAYLYQKPVLRKGHPGDAAYVSSLCTECDEAFARLWEPYLNSCDITLSRDRETLNWLYFSPARLYKRVVIQCHRSRDKTLAGYMVFDVIRINPSDVGILKLVDICVENSDPDVLASLTAHAITTGKENNAALLIVWAHDRETENYFKSTFTIRMPGIYYRYIRFTGSPDTRPGGDHYGTVCLPMIYPPQ